MTAAPAMAAVMVVGMLVMTFAFWAYAIAATFMRVRCIILEREKNATWVKTLVRKK
jgi:heme exporter protein C